VQLIEELKMRHWFEAICRRRHLSPFKQARSAPPDRDDPRGRAAAPAIMVGDSRTDVDTARAAGIPVIGVSFGYTDVPMRDLRPDVLIDHFDQLAEAVHRDLTAQSWRTAMVFSTVKLFSPSMPFSRPKPERL
jgi:phosphoglycolate phosphatase